MRELIISKSLEYAKMFGKMELEGRMIRGREIEPALTKYLNKFTDEQLLEAFEFIADYFGEGYDLFKLTGPENKVLKEK